MTGEFAKALLDDEKRADQQEARVLHEGRFVALDTVTDELQDPAADKQPHAPLPVEKDHHQRDDDGGDPYEVGQVVERMVVIGSIAVDPAIDASSALGWLVLYRHGNSSQRILHPFTGRFHHHFDAKGRLAPLDIGGDADR